MVVFTDVKPQIWVNAHYFPAAMIVFALAIFTALGWCALNIMSAPGSLSEAKKRVTWWWTMLGIPLFGIGIAIFLSRQG